MAGEGPPPGRTRVSLVGRQISIGRQSSNTPRPSLINSQPIWYERRPSQLLFEGRRTSSLVGQPGNHHSSGYRRCWRSPFHKWDEDDEQTWWFASTAIPLLAATLGPLANVFSIAALVTQWRMCLVPGIDSDAAAAQCPWDGTQALVPSLQGHHFSDPTWCFDLNVLSLCVGFVGNFFLLCNFTQRIRYIIALPVTILMWYLGAAILIGITAAMHLHVPPIGPAQQYSQGFWYAVIAACMYIVCSVLLMVNMLGYYLGHYPERFTLTDSQRTLILQTMLFFFWLAGGAAVFNRVESLYGDPQGPIWSYVNALYFCDVSVLTIGFGDIYPTSDAGRGLVFPYSVGGIIMLGLMVSSIHRFAADLGSEKIVRRHAERSRARTIGRAVTDSIELERRQQITQDPSSNTSSPITLPTPAITILDEKEQPRPQPAKPFGGVLRRVTSLATQPVRRRRSNSRLLLLREEKDRFDAMREIQKDTAKFKRWYALSMSIFAFGLLWCLGAMVFKLVETERQLSYFQALYFCYVSLLTIGYGDLAPVSTAGRPFFVFWSLIAVPTMTILVSDLGNTLINNFVAGTSRLADFTVLPKAGAWRTFLDDHPGLMSWVIRLQRRKAAHDAKKRVEEGFQVGPALEEPPLPTLDELADEEPTNEDLARKLPAAIKRATEDMQLHSTKKYSYEDWVYFTQLIRFTATSEEDRETELDEDRGLIEWDWIGEDSPMMSKSGEAEFVLARLLESMSRYIKQTIRESADIGSVERGTEESDGGQVDASSGGEAIGPKDELNG